MIETGKRYRGFEIYDEGESIIATSKKYRDKLGIKANFSQASDNVRFLDDDGEWRSSQYQVADFRHSEMAAIKHFIDEFLDFSD